MNAASVDRIVDETGANPPLAASSSVANAHASPAPKKAAPLNGSKGGAPKGNANRTTHGLRGSKFPPGAKSDESHVHNLIRRIKADYEAKHGCQMPLYAETVLQRIRRAEASARLAARWLRLEGDKLPLAERQKLLEIQNAAGDTIDRCFEKLGLAITINAADSNPASFYDRLPAFPSSAAATEDTATTQGTSNGDKVPPCVAEKPTSAVLEAAACP